MENDKTTKNSMRQGLQLDRFVKFILYGVIVVLLNIIGPLGFFKSCDITENGAYSVSKASRTAIASLKEPLTVKVFISKNLDPPYTDLAQFVEDLLKSYQEVGNKYFKYEIFDVGGSENETDKKIKDNQSLAQSYSIYPEQMQSFKNDQVSFRKVFKGMALIHGDMIQQISGLEKQRLEYRITTTLRKMSDRISVLLGLKENIKVKLFLSSDLFTSSNGLEKKPAAIKTLVDGLNKENYGKLEFQSLDPSKNADFLAEAEKLNLSYIPIADEKNKSVQKKTYVNLVVAHGDKIQKIDLLQQVFTFSGMQYQFVADDTVKEKLKDSLNSILDVNEKIGYIADHGTVSIDVPEEARQDPSYKKKSGEIFKQIISDNYSIKQIGLKDEEIPDSLGSCIIAGPRDRFTDWELFQIDQFLMSGKSLIVFADSLNEVAPQQNSQMYGYQQPPKYERIDTGLEILLEHYGVQVSNSYIFDDNSYEQANKQYGNIKLRYVPQILNENIDESLPYMKNMKGLLAIQSSPLTLVDANLKANNAKAYKLFSSSNKSWEVSENISLDPFQAPPAIEEKAKKSFPLAYVIEGEFTSYFKGKAIPERPKKESKEEVKTGVTAKGASLKESFIEKSKKAKIFVMGSSEIIKDFILEGVQPDQIFVANIVDYLNGKTDYAIMRSKLQLINPLDASKTTPGVKDFTRWFNLIVIPILVAVWGFFIFMRRQGRRKAIQTMFNKK